MQEEILSTGIDIGTSTTQLVLSKLIVKNVAPGALVPRMEITDKEVLYRSDIHMTPLKGQELVDAGRLFQLLEDEFTKAGVQPENIDTGAVIITGETAKKENARIISNKVANFAGEFVVATAGGKLESIIAGKGSGAADLSRLNHCTVVNIDIGGGTSNYGVFRNGDAIDSSCLNVGGRLLQIEKGTDRISYVSEPMEKILSHLGLSLSAGMLVRGEQLTMIADHMCEVILDCLNTSRPGGLTKELLMAPSLRLDYPVDQVMISGGVADYVYGSTKVGGTEITRYGDIGPLLGNRLFHYISKSQFQLVEPTETIRATVIGAGSRTMDVSGSTILVDEAKLPFKNVPVAIVNLDSSTTETIELQGVVSRAVSNYFEEEHQEFLAIGLRNIRDLSFRAIQALAAAIVNGAKRLLEAGKPLVLVIEPDIGKVLGQCLKATGVRNGVVCIDQITVKEGDYIDIGRPIASGTVVPVVIKSLIFETKQK